MGVDVGGAGDAVVFPGQGSQRPGMASPWRGHPAWQRWVEAEDVLGVAVARLGTDAGETELRDPVSCQLALFVHQAVIGEAWEQAAGAAPVCVAGHSLGEYNALVAAGVLTFADAVRLVHARAQATAAAALRAPGGMSACIGQPPGEVAQAASLAGAHVCNDNAPGQLVVAGSLEALDALERLLADVPGRVRRLAVGAAYHSPAMEPAVGRFMHALVDATFADARVPVFANVDASAHSAATDWRRLLARQLVQPVRWRETVLAMQAHGADRHVELGASPVLTGLAKRTAPGLRPIFVGTPPALEAAAAAVAGAAR